MFGRRRGAPRTQDGPDTTPNTPINWRRLLGYLGPHKGRMALVIGALAVSSVTGLAFPLVIVQLLGSVLDQKDMGVLTNFTGILLVLFLIQASFAFVQGYNLTYVGERIVLDLRTSVYKHLQFLSLDFYANRRVGELVSRISNDVTQVRSLLTNNLTQVLSNVVSLVGSIAIVFILNPRLVGFIVVLALVIVVVAIVFGRSFQGLSTQVQDQLAGATVAAEEGLQGVRVVKSFAREDYEVNRYNAAMEKTFGVSMRLAM